MDVHGKRDVLDVNESALPNSTFDDVNPSNS
jgi:hypothetical protein